MLCDKAESALPCVVTSEETLSAKLLIYDDSVKTLEFKEAAIHSDICSLWHKPQVNPFGIHFVASFSAQFTSVHIKGPKTELQILRLDKYSFFTTNFSQSFKLQFPQWMAVNQYRWRYIRLASPTVDCPVLNHSGACSACWISWSFISDTFSHAEVDLFS